MSIGEQFVGLDMESLIGGPLKAAADASMSLAKTMADYTNKVDEMKVETPMLDIVPVSDLQVEPDREGVVGKEDGTKKEES